MNHLKTGNAFYGQGSYKNYKFLGKELQETGFYDMGARFYMPDLGIFGQHDPLSAATLDPYGYAYNNPMFFSDPTGLYGAQVNKKGELPATSPGGADNPIDVGEVVLNAPIRAMASAIPSNCSYCYVGNGRNLVSQLNLPALRPISANINASNFNNYFPPVLHSGSVQMMSGDPFGFSDLLGILFAQLEPENQEAALGLSALAIILTRKPVVGLIAKQELNVLSRAEMANIWGRGPKIDPQNLPKSVTSDFTEILAGRGIPRMTGTTQTTLQNRSGVSLKWVGAKEWGIKDVPGTMINGSRIVQHPNGKWGLVIDHDYKKIIQIPTSSAVKWK